jgi:hypothetical protein
MLSPHSLSILGSVRQHYTLSYSVSDLFVIFVLLTDDDAYLTWYHLVLEKQASECSPQGTRIHDYSLSFMRDIQFRYLEEVHAIF